MENISPALLHWFHANHRILPFRSDPTPYHVWLSEIMLQQTRVSAALPYYERFLAALPDIPALAACEEEKLHKLWEGLGYYSRVRNLQKAAKLVCAQYGGELPADYDALRALPGIGDYTAGAIASISFGLPVPAVDGNVLRVAARIQDSFCEIDRPEQKAAVTRSLEQVYRNIPGQCGTMTQALMELGATVCLPNGQPRCEVCPLAELCLGKQYGDTMRLPQRTEKKPRRKEQYTVFVLCCDGKYAVRKRTAKGLLHGLWEYPNVSGICTTEEAIAQVSRWQCKPLDLTQTAERKHIFTHVEWELYGVYLTCGRQDEQFVWKTAAEIAAEISLPTAFRQFFQA